MTDRVQLSKRVRFEVFKRDKFACQYCGAKAPDVVLQCDHINPVASGGTNEILNLITSCKACNGGKGAIPLSDRAALDKQHDALADLDERRQQIEMMLQWRDGLRDLKEDTVEAIVRRISQVGPGFLPSKSSRAEIRRWLSKFTLDVLLEGIDAAFETYAEFGADGKVSQDSWEKAFSKIPAVIEVKRRSVEKPYLYRLFYIRKILLNRTGASVDIEFLEALLKAGMDLEFMEREAKQTDYITHFTKPGHAILQDEGAPYPGRGWQ